VLATTHPGRIWAAGGGLAVLLAALAVLALTASTQQRSDVLAQLERPATAATRATPATPATPAAQTAPQAASVAPSPAVTIGPGPAHVAATAGAYRITVSLAPNRASARDGVTLSLTRAGRPVSGAAVALSYSMPSMGMPQVLASTLHERATGTYGSLDPVLAMPGTWQLRFTVTSHGAAPPLTIVVNDRMAR